MDFVNESSLSLLLLESLPGLDPEPEPDDELLPFCELAAAYSAFFASFSLLASNLFCYLDTAR